MSSNIISDINSSLHLNSSKASLPLELTYYLMDEALKEASLAFEAGDVPIGAVIALQDKIIARAHNEVELKKDATKHAELLAIQRASNKIKDWRLNDYILCTTLEPCPMCAGAARQARLGTIIFASFDPQRGACGSLFDLTIDSRLGSCPRVITSIKNTESSYLLKTFFRK